MELVLGKYFAEFLSSLLVEIVSFVVRVLSLVPPLPLVTFLFSGAFNSKGNRTCVPITPLVAHTLVSDFQTSLNLAVSDTTRTLVALL